MIYYTTRVRECSLKFQGPNSTILQASNRQESWSAVGCSRHQRQNTLLPASTDYDTHTHAHTHTHTKCGTFREFLGVK